VKYFCIRLVSLCPRCLLSFGRYHLWIVWGWRSRRLCLAIGSIIAADWLIFGHAGGLSLAIFVTTLAVMVIATNPLRAGWRVQTGAPKHNHAHTRLQRIVMIEGSAKIAAASPKRINNFWFVRDRGTIFEIIMN
jgi:hypothetical protein